jgi:hypothetical protein
MKLGQQIDELYAMDLRIKKASAVVAKLNKLRAKLDTRLQRSFEKEELDGSKGKRGVASLRTTNHPAIKNRGKLDKWILKNKALDLYQSRLMSKAYFERLEEGQSIPGVEVFTKTRISVVKRKD